MDDDTPRNTPTPPLEDWTPALHGSVLKGALYWVLNEDNLIIDASPDVADAMGVPINNYIGQYAHELGDQVIFDPPKEARTERRERLFREGGSDRETMWADLPGLGKTVAVITSTRMTHPDTGKHYLLNSGVDVTDLEKQLDYLRAPAFQGLIMLIIEKNGEVLAATNAAATFCNPDFTLGRELKGLFIEDTQYAELKEREAAELARCRETDQPANAVEWLKEGDGSIRPFAVSRICFPEGRWMIVMQPIALTEPWLQVPPKEMIKAPNFEPKITERQLDVLVDYEAGLSPEQSAERIGCSESNVKYHRKQIANLMGLPGPDYILAALRGTELGHTVTFHSKQVHHNLPLPESD